jgi:hypothetical protein
MCKGRDGCLQPSEVSGGRLRASVPTVGSNSEIVGDRLLRLLRIQRVAQSIADEIECEECD